MATGDQADFLLRLKAVLPDGWFPPESDTVESPVLTSILSGPAWAASWLYALIAYTKNQTRIKTATDVFLDIVSQDYFGSALPRIPGETDTSFRSRILANLFLPANTRAALLAAVEAVTGYPARMIEPWQPNDTARWGAFFWGYNQKAQPGQWANGNQRYAGLIVCAQPQTGGFTGNPRFGWNNGFWGQSATYAVASGMWWESQSAAGGIQLVYDIVNRLKPEGISVFVKFVAPADLP